MNLFSKHCILLYLTLLAYKEISASSNHQQGLKFNPSGTKVKHYKQTSPKQVKKLHKY